jgi:putative aldouronate transport system substrate-binding protein
MSHDGMTSNGWTLDRRTFLRATVVAAGGGAMLLDACTSKQAATPQDAGHAELPVYQPIQGIKPDLPATADGVQPGFLTYPANPIRSVAHTPLGGGSMTAFLDTYSPPPTPESENAYWKELNRRLGCDFQAQITPDATYRDKLNTLVAGGSLPDLVQVIPSALDHLPQLAAALFVDLTPYLAGDRVKAYPNLANLPTASWRNSVVDNRIYGVPIPRAVFGNAMLAHQDLIDRADNARPGNADEFARLAGELTTSGRWAIGTTINSAFGLEFFMRMFRAPNNWRERSGRLTSQIETEEAREAVAYARKLYQAGVFYPNATQSQPQAKANFLAGKFVMYTDALIAYGAMWDQARMLNPDARVSDLIPPGHDGGLGSHYLAQGYASITAINKKVSKQRIDSLLRVIDFFAAPFGSEEYLFLTYGIKGVDYVPRSGGAPEMTPTGQNEVRIPCGYVGSGPVTLYDAQFPETVRIIHDHEARLLSVGVQDPTRGLYSPTQGQKGTALGQMVSDRNASIIAGRSPLGDYDQLIKDWRNQGGDQIRHELEQALAKRHGG